MGSFVTQRNLWTAQILPDMMTADVVTPWDLTAE